MILIVVAFVHLNFFFPFTAYVSFWLVKFAPNRCCAIRVFQLEFGLCYLNLICDVIYMYFSGPD